MTADNKAVHLERYLSHRLLFDVRKGYSFKIDDKALILSYHLDLATGVESDVLPCLLSLYGRHEHFNYMKGGKAWREIPPELSARFCHGGC